MLNRYTIGLLGLSTAVATAGQIDTDLQADIAALDASDNVAVIVRFEDSVDLDALRGDLARELRSQYPDPQERRFYRRALKRALLVEGMHQRNAAKSRPLEDFLDVRGIGGGRALWAINALAVTVPADLVDDLAAFPGVASVSSDAVVQGPGTGTTPSAPTYWNLDAIGAQALWNLGYTGVGVVIGAMDTGVDATHPDLGPRFRGGDNSWFDPYGQNGAPADFVGHGTQVMGLLVGGSAGGYQVGVAPEASWIAAKIFDNANQATLSGIHAGFQWMLDPDGNPQTDDAPDVLNNSWVLSTTVGECNQEFSADIALLREAEIAVVFAGGNFGFKANTSASPANDAGSLSVGSVDQGMKIARSSSRGPNACDGSVYPKLVAPGEGILTTDLMPGFYNVVSGTSFSVAHVSGGMALLAGAFPGATVSQLESALINGALDLGEGGPDNTYGNGRLDLAAAYDWLQANGGGTGGSPGELGLSASTYTVAETTATLTITVTRTNGSAGDIGVTYSSADQSAMAGADYVSALGTLSLLDGETSKSVDITILDDADYEGNETFALRLANPSGGATLGTADAAIVTITDNESAPGPTDADGDGYPSGVDCNDADPAIHPGAVETRHDGVDQDCNGYDLTIDILDASFASDTAQVIATSSLNSQAALEATFTLADGSTASAGMSWKSKSGRWELKIRRFSRSYGADPVSVTVSGVEGSESSGMN